MALDRTQRKTARIFLKEAKRHRASPRIKKALIEAGLVEASLRNPRGGDRDSVGSLQERSHYGSTRRRLNRHKAARRFITEAQRLEQQGFRGSAGKLAQAVQRSAFPERYDQHSKEAKSIVRKHGRGGSSARYGVKVSTKTIPGVDRSAERQALKVSYLEQRGRPGALLELAEGLKEAKDVPAQKVRSARVVRRGGGSQGRSKGGKPSIRKLASLAQEMGLRVGENPHYGGVSGGHVQGSYHYSGRAIDVSGDPKAMARYARAVSRRYGRSMKEVFWNGPGATNIKNGKRVGKGFVSGHQDHVHAAI
jgi:hypothetical protein